MNSIILKRGKEKAVLQKHPWVFSGAIQQINGNPINGELIEVYGFDKEFLAYGHFNGLSRVAIRILEWDKDKVVNEEWWRSRIKDAILKRNNTLSNTTNACRLIYSESDYLPGLIVDKYDHYLSVQILTTGIENNKHIILDELQKQTQAKGIYDKSDLIARTHDGLEASKGILWGEFPPEYVAVLENNIKYHINISEGQKSGFYCDQRVNRNRVSNYAIDAHVLDCFSYSGGFTLNCLQKGAKHVTAVDSSALAIETLKQNVELNNFNQNNFTAIHNDVNKQLRICKEQNKLFDLIILDPPKYAPSKSTLDKAARAYKDLNKNAMQIIQNGGYLATFSCSGAVDLDTFKQIIAWAALDANKEIQIIEQLHQPEDHPIRISFPEGEYLKGLILKIC